MHFDPTFILIILAGFLLIIGLIGTVVPAIPGPALAWSGLLCAYFSPHSDLRLSILIIMLVLAVAVTVLDYVLPPSMTKKAGGSKEGIWGSTIGLIAGIFLTPIFMILGPFIGALIGELIHDSSDFNRALKAAFGTFKGFLLGTGLKITAVAIFIWCYVISLIH